MFYNNDTYNIFFQGNVRPERPGNEAKGAVKTPARTFDFFETDMQPTKALRVIQSKPNKPFTPEQLAEINRAAIEFFGLNKDNFTFVEQKTK